MWPFQQTVTNNIWIKRWFLQFTPDDEVILKDRIFKIGKFRIARQLDGNVLICFVFVAHASFTMLGNQCIESGSRLYTLLNNLLDQVLLKLPILSVKVIAFIAR
ncbi:hypothetical protein BKM12_24285 [Pseudomonas syringae pv. syringae]|nr:hypothetical protein BKM12_24285 [Pseudomonas syringae pv. syringae]